MKGRREMEETEKVAPVNGMNNELSGACIIESARKQASTGLTWS